MRILLPALALGCAPGSDDDGFPCGDEEYVTADGGCAATSSAGTTPPAGVETGGADAPPVTHFSLTGGFGFDPGTGAIFGVQLGDDRLEPRATLTLYDGDAVVCDAELAIGVTAERWSGVVAHRAVVDATVDDAIADTCFDLVDIDTLLAERVAGLAVRPALHYEAEALVDVVLPGRESSVIGIDGWTTSPTGGALQPGLGFAYRLDGDRLIDTGHGLAEAIPADAVLDELPRAWYELVVPSLLLPLSDGG